MTRESMNKFSSERMQDLKPFLSVLMIISSLFVLVFFSMEVRRVGYSVLKLSREEKQLKDENRHQMIKLAKITRPERVQNVAESRLTLKKAVSGQIIQMTEAGIALKQ